MRHEACQYPNCICLKNGRTCRVSEAAEHEPYCDFCGMEQSAVERGEDCGHWEVCSNGDAEMIDPVKQAVACVRATHPAQGER